MEKLESPNIFFRVDLLTGCNNLVSFNEALSDNFYNLANAPISLIALDVNEFRAINRVKGAAFGDSLLRWCGFAIKDVTDAETYRISGDDFVAVLIGENHQAHAQKGQELAERLNGGAQQFGLQAPIVRVTVLHFPVGLPLDMAVVWKYLNEKHNYADSHDPFRVIEVDPNLRLTYETGQALVLMAQRIADLGFTLENTFGMAYTDPISGSPNMLAIQHKLDLALAEASQQKKTLSLCLLDGDDLRRYNSNDYAAGDEAIRKISAVLSASLRPNDFLGRWRMGDEFILILPDTGIQEARTVGERLRSAVEAASKDWLYPTTISIGISCCPQHGDQAASLLDFAEQALKIAKRQGKNKVVLAEP
ncbi:MAG: diguanylate cyclase [Chloroflexi bacterium]|nr:diguanylate cyclase [Chloroflexota bacterium]